MGDYVSKYTGSQIDEAVGKALAGSAGGGEPGKDGVSPVANVQQTADGAIITITDENGTTTATVTNGKNGSDATVTSANITSALGYTPANVQDVIKKQQGATNAGKILIVDADGNLALVDMPATAGGDVVGRVEEGNKIILNGNVANGTYEYWYEDDEGKQTFIGTFEHSDVTEPDVTGPVEIPLTWAHGSVLDKTNGKVTSTTDTKYSASDFVGVNPNKAYTLTRESAMYNTCNVVCYDADNNFVSYITLDMPSLNASTASNTPVLSKQFAVPSSAARIRLRLWYEDSEDAATVAAMYKLIEE